MPLFQTADLGTLAPELVLSLFAFLALIPALRRGRGPGAGLLAIALSVGALGLVIGQWTSGAGVEPVTAFSGGFVLDRFALFFKITFLLAALLAMGLSLRLMEMDRAQGAEYYSLILFATVGMMFMASGLDLLVIWLGLELMSLSSYVLCGFLKENRKSTEAALKYFLLGAFSTGVLLYGISLIYGSTGTTLLPALQEALAGAGGADPILDLGVVLLLAGFAFKIAAVPFHQWAPDVYEGAPTGITAFIATGSKAAAFAALLRIFAAGLWSERSVAVWLPLVLVLAAASMILGNVAALLQDNVKRMLAYSSIGHAGYILLGLVAVGAARDTGAEDLYRFGIASVLVYALVYTFTTVGAFGVVAALRRADRGGERVADFAGLGRRQPLLAFAMLVFLLSLAGIPATAGFVGKWYLFGAAIRADHAWLAVIAVLMSTVSAYYYLRIVVQMYMAETDSGPFTAPSGALAGTVFVALFFTLLIGLYPQPVLDLARQGTLPLPGLP